MILHLCKKLLTKLTLMFQGVNYSTHLKGKKWNVYFQNKINEICFKYANAEILKYLK